MRKGKIPGQRIPEWCGLYDRNFHYEDLIEYIEEAGKIEVKEFGIFACVEVTFEETQKTVSLYFQSNGQFYFDGNWYNKSDCLFYGFFHYFSDEIVPESELKVKYPNNRCF